jgi:hypothetical protein
MPAGAREAISYILPNVKGVAPLLAGADVGTEVES